MSDAEAALLRSSYNEYPERTAWDVRFPAAGRRGGSRPALQQDGAPVGVGGSTEANGPAPEPPIYSPYPVPRPVDVRGPLTGIAAINAREAPGAQGAFDPCIGEGDSWVQSASIVNSAEGNRSSRRIARPFVITHLQYWGENGVPASTVNVRMKLFVSRDNDQVSSWDAVRGTDVFGMGDTIHTGEDGMMGQYTPITRYPGFVWRESGAYLKMAYKSLYAGTIYIHFVVSWRYIG
jgi:hypothetical protein